MTSITNNA